MGRTSCKFFAEISLGTALTVLVIAYPAESASQTDKPEAESQGQLNGAADSSGSIVQKDTTLFDSPPAPTRAAIVTNPMDLEKHLYQNPTAALFKSMLVPGLGQLGNRRYVKATVVIGLQSWFIVSAVHYANQASDAKKVLDATSDPSSRLVWYDLFDNKRKNRNKFLWFAGITAFLSMFDAYVDAHLSGSPTNERNQRFSIDLVPDGGGGVSASLAMRF